MTWKETCPMKERVGFIVELQRGERTMSETCRIFGVSRKTGYKWLDRYQQFGAAGLEDQSRAPHAHPNAVAEDVKARLLQVRLRHPDWGPIKLLDWLALNEPQWCLPVASTVAALLGRHALVKLRRRHRRSVPYGAPFVQATAPNELWSADFKGQFRLGNGRLCYPLTISDGASRYLLCCQGLSRPTWAQTQPYFEQVFRRYGLPAAIRTDNGAPFASSGLGGISRLALWWIKLGIVPERIRAGHPEQNARHERMHGTLKRACAVQSNFTRQQRAFDRFRREYNTERPHQALGRAQTPQMHYARSPRAYPRRLPELVYPQGYALRRVMPSGSIGWVGRKWYLAGLLAGETIGLYPIDDGIWHVFVGSVAIGRLDARAQHIAPVDTTIDVPTVH